jgi:hypothetical protein
MKRIIIAAAAVLVLLIPVISSAHAAPVKFQPKLAEPFEGTFSGVIYGDRDSQAPLKLEIRQDRNEVLGTLDLGSGLFINAGRCGGGYIPSTIQFAEGEVDGRRIEASTAIKVAGFKVKIELEGLLSNDGETLAAEAKVDLPWLCGRDPVIDASLVKEL